MNTNCDHIHSRTHKRWRTKKKQSTTCIQSKRWNDFFLFVVRHHRYFMWQCDCVWEKQTSSCQRQIMTCVRHISDKPALINRARVKFIVDSYWYKMCTLANLTVGFHRLHSIFIWVVDVILLSLALSLSLISVWIVSTFHNSFCKCVTSEQKQANERDTEKRRKKECSSDFFRENAFSDCISVESEGKYFVWLVFPSASLIWYFFALSLLALTSLDALSLGPNQYTFIEIPFLLNVVLLRRCMLSLLLFFAPWNVSFFCCCCSVAFNFSVWHMFRWYS